MSTREVLRTGVTCAPVMTEAIDERICAISAGVFPEMPDG